MDVPATVQNALDGESVVAEVGLNGENALYVTPTRTIYFRADGLLSDESADSFPHDAERLSVSEGRRKATITLDYGTDGERSFSVPTGHIDQVIHPVLAGVLAANGVTGPGETITRTQRFSELTLVVTTERIVKHVGAATWDIDYEEIPYADVRGLDIEDGAVAAQLVIETGERVQRVKVPAESAREVQEYVEEALFDFYDAGSYAEFERVAAADDDPGADVEPEPAESTGSAATAFDSPGLDPIDTGGNDADADAGEAVKADTATGAERADDTAEAAGAATGRTPDATLGADPEPDDSGPDAEELAARVEELEEALARQEDLLAKQRVVLGELAAEVQDARE
jgi:hypothetical protein